MLVGVPACARVANGRLEHATPARYVAALMGGAGVVPVQIPPIGAAALAILDRLDGLLLPGSPSNVEPAQYGAEDETPDQHDPARDSTTLPLIREALQRGIPMLAICRGIQELNVALGGSLIQRVHLQPGCDDHRGQGATLAERYALRHDIAIEGRLAAMLGRSRTRVNSVHGQAIERLAPGLVVEGRADDGTVEAVRVEGAYWAIGVQWHPEWDYAAHADSVKLFKAFGDACRAFAARHTRQAA